jgi:hypothetical protein
MKRLSISCALLAGISTFTGCVSSKYQQAPKGTPSAVTLGLAAVHAPNSPESSTAIDAIVQTVIVYGGPGSWKRAAYWDEYVLSLANRSNLPLTVESAILTDFQGRPVASGDNPWSLEKESRSYEAQILHTVGDVLKVGSATVLTGTAAGSVLVYGALHTASQAGAAMVVGGTVLFAAATVAIPVCSVIANVSSRHSIETEFQRRQLRLPVWLMPGQFAQGSLFFRISPGPQLLRLHCRAGDEPRDVVIDLAPLADLHLKGKTPVPGAKLTAK